METPAASRNGLSILDSDGNGHGYRAGIWGQAAIVGSEG